ncbi:LLM class flavin-dependent oxidoreductase [Mycetocola tolaasinivorans]|uniref:LLM class flavin-dependent oxidoreductase n=1 Tax=Mycetocola tolaasinivorans TaxID=76635 RepID=A0A3L7A8W6_9MICO|nr:LLM class flavin-dependent oxidoreductase [Mycetocola tolaasinivorans]RLP76779.1 LLM class flavin-dependent oxidoreductase [Mycetocola tolaasinivorans]
MGEALRDLRLSILDQSPITDDLDRDATLRESLSLAELADREGYHRLWFAEHHNSLSFGGAAPEILTALALQLTSRIRVGTGGILLPLYAPQKVAESLGLLQRIHGDRVDIGVGRAAFAAMDFRERLEGVRSLLPPGFPEAAREPEHRVWVLGAGGSSATLAGQLGAGYAQGHFLAPSATARGLHAYREAHESRPGFAILAVRAVTADTAEEARCLARAMALWRARKDLGIDGPIPSIERAAHGTWSEAERVRADVREAEILHGTPHLLAQRVRELAGIHGTDEVMVNTLTSDPRVRAHSYMLLAEAFRRDGGG